MFFNLILSTNLPLYAEIITIVVPIVVAVLIPLLIYIFTIQRENKLHLIDKFKRIYTQTFLLRKNISEQYSSVLIDENFYYEIDQIISNADIREYVLDYLTEMEDLFYFAINGQRLNRVFKNLMSYALYSRLSNFYGLIIKLRKANNNFNMFPKYVEVLEKIENLKKIKCHIQTHEKIYYIGIRQSDIYYSKGYFEDCIAMFSKNNAANYALRPNQNKPCNEYFPYLEGIYHSKQLGVNDKYMTYNPKIAYGLDSQMQDNFICLNDINLINFLNDKVNCKHWLDTNGIPIIAFETKYGNTILSEGLSLFNNSNEVVVQSNHGGGGVGTFIFTKQNFNELKHQIQPLKQYMISSYLHNSISVNTHVFISEKQTVLSPGSVQIIELIDNQLCYRGADYIAFNTLSEECKLRIKSISLRIANILRNRNYRGVAGIDFIISEDGNVYCSEINPRFQASSILLDKYLAESSDKQRITAKSIYELNEQAFSNNMKTSLSFEDKIDLSCYYYYKEDLPLPFFENKIEMFKQLGVTVDLDGLNLEDDFDENSYMFRAVFNHQICSISPDNELWVNDNIKIVHEPANMLYLKIALLNQGVRIINAHDNIKTGVYESVDISFSSSKYNTDSIDINCAVGINLAQYSPYTLNCENNKLYYYNMELGTFTMECDLLADFSEDERKILYIATDRLRIKIVNGCEFKNRGIGCRFCNVPSSTKHYNLQEIINALEKLKSKQIFFRHILIGGGTCLDANIWDEIIAVVKYIKKEKYFKDKPISLMSIFPPREKLSELKTAGITEVAFNVEIADENLAQQNMPGKYFNKSYFFENMSYALEVFGVGNVRSAMLVGLDKQNTLINMVNEMAQKEILPCLSAFRALPKARTSLILNPTNSYLYNVYINCINLLKGSSSNIKELGPLCKHCGNNMLIL